MHSRIFGIQPDRPLEVLRRLFKVPRLKVGVTQSSTSSRIIRVCFDNVLKFGNSLLSVIEGMQVNVGDHYTAVGQT